MITLDRWISGHRRFSPDKAAIIGPRETLTYRQLDDRIAATAAVFEATFGLARGDRVALLAKNDPETFVLVFAAARLGLILVPLNWRLALPELGFIVTDCAPKLLVHDSHFAAEARSLRNGLPGCRTLSLDKLAAARAAPDPHPAPSGAGMTDPVLIVYTSGTTGTPKGAVLSQAALRCNAQMSQHAYDMTAADHVLNVLPLFHVGGLNIQPVPALLHGATLTVHDRFDPAATLAAIADGRVTLINLVPTILKALTEDPAWAEADLSSLKAISIGSTDVPRELIAAVHARDVPLIQIYGATETSPIAIYQRIDQARSTEGSIGRCGLLCDVRLVGEDGADVAEGERGEIRVRGENVLDRYWNNAGETGRALVDGWFRTGDVASRDGDGNYWFADRIRHIIISGGENIYPAELERILREHDGLAEAAVVGRPDPRWGMVPVVLAVRARPEVTAGDVLDRFTGRIARFKTPRDVVFVDALPRNALGKVRMEAARALALDPAAPGQSTRQIRSCTPDGENG